MYNKAYSINYTIYDKEENKFKHEDQVCFSNLRDFDAKVSKLVIGFNNQGSNTSYFHYDNFLLLKEWLNINASYRGKQLIIMEDVQTHHYYFNIAVYMRMCFECPYINIVPTYVATFGDEFNVTKFLVTTYYLSVRFKYATGHMICRGLYKSKKITVKELKERFKTNNIYDSWQERSDQISCYQTIMNNTLKDTYEEIIESIHPNE